MLHPPHYDPLQPRVPKGHEGGGRWTRAGDHHEVRTAFLGPAPVVVAPAIEKAIVAALALFTWLSMYNSRKRVAVIGFNAREYKARGVKILDLNDVRLIDADRVAQACNKFGTVQWLTNTSAETVRSAIDGEKHPAEFGTAVHSRVKSKINGPDKEQVIDDNFKAEVSYVKMKMEGVYGQKGSIRIDVLERVGDGIVCVYDIKTGKGRRSGLTPQRMLEIAKNVFKAYPGTTHILVIEVRPGIDPHPASPIYRLDPRGGGWVISP